jgi:hypothetical protein
MRKTLFLEEKAQAIEDLQTLHQIVPGTEKDPLVVGDSRMARGIEDKYNMPMFQLIRATGFQDEQPGV